MFKLIAAVVMLSASLAFAGTALEVMKGTGAGSVSSAGTATPRAEKLKSSRAPKKEAPTAAPSTAAPEKSADPK